MNPESASIMLQTANILTFVSSPL